MKRSIAQDPSALLPLGMSAAALLLVLGHILLVGVARQADEGAEAHIWQLLIAGQVPVIAFFAIRWLPRAPSATLVTLALQLCAVWQRWRRCACSTGDALALNRRSQTFSASRWARLSPATTSA